MENGAKADHRQGAPRVVAVEDMAELMRQDRLDVLDGEPIQQALAENDEVTVHAAGGERVDHAASLNAQVELWDFPSPSLLVKPLVDLAELVWIESLTPEIEEPRHHPRVVQMDGCGDERHGPWCGVVADSHDDDHEDRHKQRGGRAAVEVSTHPESQRLIGQVRLSAPPEKDPSADLEYEDRPHVDRKTKDRAANHGLEPRRDHLGKRVHVGAESLDPGEQHHDRRHQQDRRGTKSESSSFVLLAGPPANAAQREYSETY